MPGWVVGLVLFLAGTEIRVRAEEGLLLVRFGAKFVEWRRSVPAYFILLL
jgi:protein-S-isoprenylcysteine O-methyltransferase Ste14